jgi:hydroxymethylglutaryl-CoA synthase
MMKPERPVGITGYGVYIPRFRIAAREIARVWDGAGGTPVDSKSVPGPDEDTITMSIEAARNALARAHITPDRLSAVWVGSESHPYSVKPSGTLVAETLGATPWISTADWEFACKAGSEALTAAMGMVGSGMAEYVLAIGADHGAGSSRRCAGVHRRSRRSCADRRSGDGCGRGHRGNYLVCDRHP